MADRKRNTFGVRDTFDTGSGSAYIYRIEKLAEQIGANISRFPFSIKILLEALLRECDGYLVNEEDVTKLAKWNAKSPEQNELPYKPARVILQDFTGVPAVVDLAAMRSAMSRAGGDPKKINPVVPVDLVIDHSVQVDTFGTADAADKNTAIEFQRNNERYEFLRWGQNAFDNFGVVPPGRGIIHQVNLEYLARAVWSRPEEDGIVAYPDTLVGTDSHTTMINGLGIMGWGVGGIEAEAVMLGQPIYMLTPEVVGMKLSGQANEGVTATDITLTATQMLRAKGVVGKFVEFFGPGLTNMTLQDRATLANMAPEYGATMGFFPIDEQSLTYMRRTGRSEDLVQLVERYCKELGIFRTDDSLEPEFTDTIELDLSSIEPSLAGPKRPQDRVTLSDMQSSFKKVLSEPIDERGFGLEGDALTRTGEYKNNGNSEQLAHGAVAIAAITSCTNTSNPSVMIGAGLVAKKAVEKGLTVPTYVKTSLAPGSRVVTEYLKDAGLLTFLEQIGFSVVGYGCTTCIGNSGPLPTPVEDAINSGDLIAAGVLSGNRNFEGRIHAKVKANYLASPPLVVAYALAGTVDIDMNNDPIGNDKDGNPVVLKDIWPSNKEILDELDSATNPETYKRLYDGVETSNEDWNKIEVSEGDLYEWNDDSTYIHEPPFFVDLSEKPTPISPISNARVLIKVGDSITTDHISPAGAFTEDTPAGKFLVGRSVEKKDFNSYGSRRGNDLVMTRGTFANIRIKNQLAPGTEGGFTTDFTTGEVSTVYDASSNYKSAGIPLVVLSGKEYGTGSSRDWAAKGTNLLGVKVVIAESYERIHRSNLVGMGVLPLQYKDGESAESLGLDGTESFNVHVDDSLKARQEVKVDAISQDGKTTSFSTMCRVDTPVEVDYYRNGGILHTVLRNFISE